MVDVDVLVCFGGVSPEHEISILTGLQCERILRGVGVETRSLYWAPDGRFFLIPQECEATDFVDGPPAKAQALRFQFGGSAAMEIKGGLRSSTLEAGVVLNACHGGAGEAGGLKSLFDLLRIPCTGGSAHASALGMDKLAFGSLVAQAGLSTLPRVLLTPEQAPAFEPPYIIKPRFGGSSLGIEVVRDWQSALDLMKSAPLLQDGAVVEPYLEGVCDLNVSFVTSPEFATSPVERPLRGESSVYSFEEKYLRGGLQESPREFPAKISDEMAAEIKRLTERVVVLGGFSGIGRLDFLSHEDKVYVNEMNTIPGAMALHLWQGVKRYSDLLVDMIDEAKRQGVGPASVQVSGRALRVAGISQKLGGI